MWVKFKNLWPVWALLLVVVGQIALIPGNDPLVVIPLLLFAYVQNISFGLTSRSRNRSSVIYHFLAATLSTFIFFWMLRKLILSELTLALFFPYVAGTVAGSITGAQISSWIEKKIGAVMDIASGTPISKRSFIFQVWPLVFFGSILAAQFLVADFRSEAILFSIAGLLFLQNFSYTIVSRAGNRNNHLFLLGTSIFNGIVQFFIYQKLVAYKMDWPMLIPYLSGSVSGGIAGAAVSAPIEKKTKASADAHVKTGAKIKIALWPFILLPIAVFVFAAALHNVLSHIFLFGLAVTQNFAFLAVSRARNRDNIAYHAIASVFSNGVWFLTFRQLYVSDLELPFIVPYALGIAVGSLAALYISLLIEKKISSVADAHIQPKKA